MARNVALSNEAYATLERIKRSNESFSDVVKRISGRGRLKPNWRDFSGVWKDDKEAERVFSRILEERHMIKERRVLKW